MNGRYVSTLLICAAFAVLGGCGAGGTGADSDAEPTLAGIEGSGITSSGRITALGSIVVNDVRYDVAGATVTINGAPASTLDLVPGQITIVEGTIDSSHADGKATRVSVEIAVAGPVSAVDIVNSRMTILGQTIEVPAGAIIPSAAAGSPLGGMQVGRDVEVSGFADSTGVLYATRIDLRRGATPLLVSGYVTGLDGAARTFMVNGQAVDYSAAALVGFASPVDGARVRVVVGALRQDVAVAQRIELLSARLPGAPGDSAELQGWVTRVHSESSFEVNGYRVIAADPEALPPGAITLDSFVRVEGSITGGGALRAIDFLSLTPGDVGGEITVDGAKYLLRGFLARPGDFRLAIVRYSEASGPGPETEVAFGQLIGTIDFASFRAAGNAVLIGENCGLPSTNPFCGGARPVRIVLQPPAEAAYFFRDSLRGGTGSLLIATPAGEQNWPLTIHAPGDPPAIAPGFVPVSYPSYLEYLAGQLFHISTAEFAQGSPVYMTIDGSHGLFFQSAATGCVGNGHIGAHVDPAINLYRVTLRIEACPEPFTHMNADFAGLARLESWNYWAGDLSVLRFWVSTTDGAERPAALSFWGMEESFRVWLQGQLEPSPP